MLKRSPPLKLLLEINYRLLASLTSKRTSKSSRAASPNIYGLRFPHTFHKYSKHVLPAVILTSRCFCFVSSLGY